MVNAINNNSNIAFFALNNGNSKIAIRSPLHLLPPKFEQHYGRRVMTSPGLDDILNRVLKIPKLEGEVMDMLIRHYIALNIENTIPDDWRKSVIVSMPKKGNSTALDNQ